jgi:lipopolysaccharide transport protein LptA
MANSYRSIGFLLTLLAALGRAQEVSAPQPISLDAESSAFDGKTSMVTFRGLHITQGNMTIAADQAIATGLDFEKSEWTFTGNVKIAIESAQIQADEAHFEFADHALLSGELRGNPAIIEDTGPDGGSPIRGGANRLYYSRQENTLRLSEGAWLSEGQNEIRGCDLIYDLTAERVTSGSSDCGEPVRITILPPKDDAEPSSSDTP